MNNKVKLGEVCDLQNGFAFKSNLFKKDGLPVIRITNINNQQVDTDRIVYFDPIDYGQKEFSSYKVLPGDLLIAMSGATTGKVGINTSKKTFYLNQRVGNLKPKSTLDKRYLFHVLSTKVSENLSKAIGAAQPNLSSRQIKDITFHLPPLEEQRRIAQILDLTNQSKERYLKMKILFLKSIFSYLSEVTRDCTSNNWKWNLIPLKEVTTSKLSNGIFKKNHQYLKTKEGLPVVWVKNLFSDYAINTNECPYINANNKEINQFSLEYGDILFCRSSLKREGIAFPNIYLGDSGNALFECHTIRLRVDQKKINPIFLNLWLRTNFMRKIAISESKTSTMTTIDQQGVLRLPVILPPMNIQNKISNIYLICRELSAKLNSISQLNEEFSSSLYSSLIR